LLGVLVMASASGLSSTAKEKVALCLPPLAMALRNAISHSQMQQLAALDALTGVYNRRFGDRRIREEFGRAVRVQAPLSLLMLDIDHFKTVNDAYGHMVGDKVLVAVAQTVMGAIREGDVLVRYGGEEFLCVLPGASRHDVGLVADRIRVLVSDAVVRNSGQELRVTVSVGTASYPNGSVADAEQLIKLADEAMYEAKATGRNRVVSI
jgi:diguanylate cyclase (GGDEF)-like protein